MPVLDVIVKAMRLRCVDVQVLVTGTSEMKSILWTRLSSKSSRIATFIRYLPGPNLANSWSKDLLATKATPLYVRISVKATIWPLTSRNQTCHLRFATVLAACRDPSQKFKSPSSSGCPVRLRRRCFQLILSIRLICSKTPSDRSVPSTRRHLHRPMRPRLRSVLLMSRKKYFPLDLANSSHVPCTAIMHWPIPSSWDK